MPTPNEVTIYSSGIADFRRVFALSAGQPREVTLAVKKPHVADVLESLNIYGDVTLAAPPTFAPENEHQGTLVLDPAKAIEQLAAQLCGSRVRVERAGGGPIAGTLLGLHTESEATQGSPAAVKYVFVLTDSGVAKLAIREVSRLAFEDESVRQELAKALRRQAEALHPDSTQIRLSLTADAAEAEAVDIPRMEAMFEQAEGPLLTNPAFQKCLDLQQQVQAKRHEISRANEQVKSLGGRQERLRKNLGVAGNDEQSARWRAELGEVETRITELEETTLPRLERERGELESQLREALKAVILEWTFAGTADEEAALTAVP